MINLQIETCSTCNAACSFCDYPTHQRWRSGKMMPFPLFTKIVDEVADMPLISLLTFNGLNEPLLDPLLDERISYAKSKVTHAAVQLFTNGFLLSPARLHRLRVAGLDRLSISLNAVTADQHARIMGRPKMFERVCLNVEHAISAGGVVRVHALITGDTFTEADRDLFLARWGDHGIVRYSDRLSEPKDADLCCWRAVRCINVIYDGRVTPCAFDHSGKMVMGDLNTQSLRDIYNNDPYLGFRAAHAKNQAATYDLCKNCKRGYDG